MCPWIDTRAAAVHGGLMQPEVWDAVRPYLPHIQSVDLSGGGEPLLQPRLAQWARESKSAGCETGFLTNGLLLTKEKSREFIDGGIDWVGVSMDGATPEVYEAIRRGSDFGVVCRNISDLARMRSGHTPKIMINFVMMALNRGQEEAMVRLAVSLGADQLNVKHCDVIRGAHGRDLGVFSSSETDEIKDAVKALDSARRLAEKLGLATTAFSFTPSELPVCAQDPRTSFFVRWDGMVAPCINLAIGGPSTFMGRYVTITPVHYGRLPDNDLLEMWHGEICVRFRERFHQRFRAYGGLYLDALMGGTTPDTRRIEEHAPLVMPEAPGACRVCHYLYNV
jgi:MoaA/NifB/PqqE/SkfB family radical SAM enzyme